MKNVIDCSGGDSTHENDVMKQYLISKGPFVVYVDASPLQVRRKEQGRGENRRGRRRRREEEARRGGVEGAEEGKRSGSVSERKSKRARKKKEEENEGIRR